MKTSEASKDELSDDELSDEEIDDQHFSDDDDDMTLHDKTTTPHAGVSAPGALIHMITDLTIPELRLRTQAALDLDVLAQLNFVSSISAFF